MGRLLNGLVLTVAISIPVAAQSRLESPPAQQRDSASVARAAMTFLVAFDSLRWAPFAAAWASRATVFLPDEERPHLLTGREEILRYFRELFDEVRPKQPSLGILPAVRDYRITFAGSTVALLTFELGDGAMPGRRTLVWAWDAPSSRWLLTHLHASRLSTS